MKTRQFFGWFLYAVGGFVAVLSGGCTVYFMMHNIMYSTDRGDLLIPLMVGGIPFVISLLWFFLGRALLRSGNDAKDEKPEI
jgi:hypothetical protein